MSDDGASPGEGRDSRGRAQGGGPLDRVDPVARGDYGAVSPSRLSGSIDRRSRAQFAHASEAEMARILDFYAVRWDYEPVTFPILWNLDGDVVESFSPDFYLPELDLFLEMTTLKQKLVRKKNRKLRRLRELYPDIRIKLFYARDFRAMLLKYGRLGLLESLSGTLGQVTPERPAEARSEAGSVGAAIAARESGYAVLPAMAPAVAPASVVRPFAPALPGIAVSREAPGGVPVAAARPSRPAAMSARGGETVDPPPRHRSRSGAERRRRRRASAAALLVSRPPSDREPGSDR